jgi:hypothetical protein
MNDDFNKVKKALIQLYLHIKKNYFQKVKNYNNKLE